MGCVFILSLLLVNMISNFGSYDSGYGTATIPLAGTLTAGESVDIWAYFSMFFLIVGATFVSLEIFISTANKGKFFLDIIFSSVAMGAFLFGLIFFAFTDHPASISIGTIVIYVFMILFSAGIVVIQILSEKIGTKNNIQQNQNNYQYGNM